MGTSSRAEALIAEGADVQQYEPDLRPLKKADSLREAFAKKIGATSRPKSPTKAQQRNERQRAQAERLSASNLQAVEERMVAELTAQQLREGVRPSIKPLTPNELLTKLNALKGNGDTNFETVARLIILFDPDYIERFEDIFIESLVTLLREGRKIDDVLAAKLSNRTKSLQSSRKFRAYREHGDVDGVDPGDELRGRDVRRGHYRN